MSGHGNADHPFPSGNMSMPSGEYSFREVMEDFERRVIEEALSRCRGNRTQASRRFGIPRKTLHRKIRKYGLGMKGER